MKGLKAKYENKLELNKLVGEFQTQKNLWEGNG